MGKLIKILVVLVLLVVAAIAGIILTTDINQYKPQIVQAVKDNTGRDFEISGDLKLAPSLIPTVAIEGVSLGNASWAKEKNMLSVGKFEAQVALMPLLKKNIQVVRLILIEPNIHLETNEQGQGNWVLSSASDKKEKQAAKSASSELPALAVNEVRIEKANISYKDGKTGKMTELLIDEITVNSSSFSDPMALLVKASFNKSPLNIEGTLGSVNNLMDNKNYPVKLDIGVAGAEVSVDGTIGQPMSAKGINLQTSLNISKLSDLNQVAGSELPDVGPIIFSGKLSDTESGYAVKSMVAQLMEYKVNGDIDVSMAGARPKLNANLTSESLDISPFQGEEKEKVKKEKMFSSDPLPLDGLKAADVNLTFKTKKLITKDLIITDAAISLNLNNGKLKLSKSGKAAGGTLAVNVDLDGSNGKTAVLNNSIEIKQIELGQIPSIQEKKLITGGKTDITIKAKGTGSSVSQIMAGLNGKLLVQAGKGQISNTALELASADALVSTLSMLTPGAKESDGSLLECAVVNFNIKDGLATAENGIAMSTNHMNVIGAGTIDFKTEKLDIGITPKAKEGIGLNLGQLAGLVRVGGTLTNPSPKADAEGALKTGLSAGAAVATGGLSLLAENFLSNGVADDTNPCDIALGKAPVKSAAKEKPAEEKNAVEKTTDTVKDAAGAIGDKLKSLF
ncbi:MAG: AsmA family protein [Proteobacteria bacterium]|nr:AsmA family protein [Pseudomonadota bacterium]NOG59405.1 AsmA family protein [Pseudomonadota bacterium]